MALATHTITINPAFLQEIKEDHHELRQLLHHTTAMLERSLIMRVEHVRLAELFNKLRDQLAMHFSLEEAYGYFNDAILEAPRLSRRAEILKSEHGELYSDLTRLADDAEQLRYEDRPTQLLARLADEFSRFYTQFQEHEARECDMIQEAINDELGAGD